MAKLLVIASPPDLDSVASIYLLRRALSEDLEVRYLEHSVIENSEADYIVDSPHGKARTKRFDHHDSTERSCSAMKVVAHFHMGDAERRFAEAVCWQDNAGWRELGKEGMDNLLDTALKSLIVAGYEPKGIEGILKPIFDSMIKKFEEDNKATKEIGKGIVYRSDGGEVLAVMGDFPKDILFQAYGPKILVRLSRWGISVTRSARYGTPDLNNFKNILKSIGARDLERWFFHPQGFYFGYSIDPDKPVDPPVDLKKLSEELYKFSIGAQDYSHEARKNLLMK